MEIQRHLDVFRLMAGSTSGIRVDPTFTSRRATTEHEITLIKIGGRSCFFPVPLNQSTLEFAPT